MALITHQAPGFTALAAGEKLCFIRVKFNRRISSHLVARSDKLSSLKHYSHFRSKPYILNQKPFKISSFKSNGQTDEASETDAAPKIVQKIAPPSIPDEREETLASPPTERDEKTAKKRFIKWPISGRSRTVNISGADEVHDEASSDAKSSKEEKSSSAIRAAFLWFMRLDATIKIPILIFIPWYISSRVVYGPEVTKELTPLWVIGPLITALYIKLMRGICFLYVFSFKLAIKFIENVPGYTLIIYRFIAEGRVQGFIYSWVCQPIVDIKNMDYKELGRKKSKEIKAWAVESYLDYVESIWPYYCRMIRFLKRANLL